MSVSCCNRYVQIELFEESELLAKMLKYSTKHFSAKYRLSSSLLILDDGERFKKDYLVNWAYHASLQEGKKEGKSDLDTLLSNTHLPIRIKILKKNDILHKVKISLKVMAIDKIVLVFEKKNGVARRYLKHLFGSYCYFECENEMHLRGSGNNFWQQVLNAIGSKIIHNVVIEFDYDGFVGEKFGSSFLTEDERNLRKCYLELESKFDDDFASVKRRYLSLARLYHPDNVYGKDECVVQDYHQKFTKINQAFEMIKKISKNVS